MDNKIRLISILFFFFPIITWGQKQKLLFSSEYFNPLQQKFIKDNKLENVYIIYQDKILDSFGKLDKIKMKESINATIPNVNQQGYGILDVEDENYYIISGLVPVSLSKYDKVLKDYVKKNIEILKYAKYLRPNMKWSFFDMQSVMYPEMKLKYIQLINKNDQLIKEVDFFAPALYLDYSYSDMQKKLFLESNIKYSLQLGKEFKKPVFPFVWHRYSLISGKYAQIKINEKKFNNYIANILNFTFNNCKVDGVIWWNGESSGYAGRKNSKNINDEYLNIKSPEIYQIQLLQRYLDAIKGNFR